MSDMSRVPPTFLRVALTGGIATGKTVALGRFAALGVPTLDADELARDAVFYLDPHVCMRCRYRSTELLWQCPQCHEWNTFIEERMAPAKGDEDAPA